MIKLVYVDSKDCLRLRKNNMVYEKTETILLEKLLKEGDTFVDVGAHIGYYTAMASGIVGNAGSVFAFEPDTANYELLCKNIETLGLKNVYAYRLAVADFNGKHDFFLNKNNAGDHRMIYNNDALDREVISIDVIRLDDFEPLKNKRVNFVKIDIQGGEYPALIGADSLISRSNRLNMLVEYGANLQSMAGYTGRQLILWLRKHGFQLRGKSNGKWVKLTGDLLYRYRDKHLNVWCKKVN